jgi:hypothetical protein
MDFNISSCNKIYFEELIVFLNTVNPECETIKKTNKKEINKLNIVCNYYLKNCETDIFFFENKKQIILGRFPNTVSCFYKCSKNYFTIAIDPHSIFKNDLFIRYVIDKHELFISDNKKIKIETIFPIRIILSEEFKISNYSNKLMYSIDEYISNSSISKKNLNIIKSLPNNSIFKNMINDSNTISREICLLYYMKFYFYIVKITENKILPFILISKYSYEDLKKIYQFYRKPIPNFYKLF